MVGARVEPTTDMEVVGAILNTPGLRELIIDDSTPDDLEPQGGEGVYWLLAYYDDELVGVYHYHAMNAATFITHANILPTYWGAPWTDEVSLASMEWMRRNTPARRFVSFIPDDCEHVVTHAKRNGFKVCGYIPDSFLKDGILKSQIIMSRK